MLNSLKNKLASIIHQDPEKNHDVLGIINQRIDAMEQSILDGDELVQNDPSAQLRRINLELTRLSQLLIRNSQQISLLYSYQKRFADSLGRQDELIKGFQEHLEELSKEVTLLKNDRKSLEANRINEFDKRLEIIEHSKEELLNVCEKSRDIMKSIDGREEELRYIDENIKEKLSDFVTRNELLLTEDALRIKIDRILQKK
ncbi:hypothetical protein JXA85_07180 [Candidatus Woesearchaeota archaeon]|nr:hypothetical protein [Candidatus Woesearchaeota archaeon]